jgi:hypothetical protein
MSKKDDDAWRTLDAPQTNLPRQAAEAHPKFRTFVDALADLSPNQRRFVRKLPECHYVPAEAARQLQAAGMRGISSDTARRWMGLPEVKRAVEVYKELAGEFAGVDALSVMLRVSAWADYCAEIVPIFGKKGEMVGERRRDPANGLRALELLGRHTGALGKEDAQQTARLLPAFIVGINIAAPERPAIDVQVTEVRSD